MSWTDEAMVKIGGVSVLELELSLDNLDARGFSVLGSLVSSHSPNLPGKHKLS